MEPEHLPKQMSALSALSVMTHQVCATERDLALVRQNLVDTWQIVFELGEEPLFLIWLELTGFVTRTTGFPLAEVTAGLRLLPESLFRGHRIPIFSPMGFFCLCLHGEDGVHWPAAKLKQKWEDGLCLYFDHRSRDTMMRLLGW